MLTGKREGVFQKLYTGFTPAPCMPCTPAGQRLASPILFAPMAQQRLCHPDGELAMARAAAASGLPYILSTMATSSIQEVAEAVAAAPEGGWPCDPTLWFQARWAGEGGRVAGWVCRAGHHKSVHILPAIT